MRQPSQTQLFDAPSSRGQAVDAAINQLAEGTDIIGRGAVFTRWSVVDAILDLAGYCEDRPLAELRLLEPSFGAGDFLLPAVNRLLASYQSGGGTPVQALRALSGCIRAVEIHAATFEKTRRALNSRLVTWGISELDADKLSNAWLVRDDFLLADLDGPFDVVVGNPPYVRQERVPAPLSRFSTSQGGRGAVVSGKNMDGFMELVRGVVARELCAHT